MNSILHTPDYQVSGQAGKALDASRVSLQSIGVTSATLSLVSLAADTLTWYQEGGPAPEYGQEVALWDANGKRVFQGNVTASDPDWNPGSVTGYSVVISGVWWWLELAQLTALVTDANSNASERPMFVCPAQDLAISIRSLINRMQELGVPIQCGNIADTFPVIQMTHQGTTADVALKDMIALIPDAMTRMNYDVDGYPALEVYRRPTANTFTLETGTDKDLTGIPKLRARRSIRPESVRVQSMEVNDAGQIVYTEQTAGDISGASGVLGRQLIAVSGPGRPDFRNVTPRVGTLQTATIALDYASTLALDPTIQNFITDFGPLGLTSGVYNDVGYQPTLTRQVTGLGKYRVIAGATTEWMKEKLGIVSERTKVSGYYFCYVNAPYSATLSNLIGAGYANAGLVSGTYCGVFKFEFEVETINISYPTLSVLVHPDDKALVTPVPNLAENLYLAQDWIPYDGQVPLHPGAEIPLPGNVLNIRGALPEWETMRSLVTGVSLDLVSGSSTLTVGAPSRMAPSSLIDSLSRPLSGRIINL